MPTALWAWTYLHMAFILGYVMSLSTQLLCREVLSILVAYYERDVAMSCPIILCDRSRVKIYLVDFLSIMGGNRSHRV